MPLLLFCFELIFRGRDFVFCRLQFRLGDFHLDLELLNFAIGFDTLLGKSALTFEVDVRLPGLRFVSRNQLLFGFDLCFSGFDHLLGSAHGKISRFGVVLHVLPIGLCFGFRGAQFLLEVGQLPFHLFLHVGSSWFQFENEVPLFHSRALSQSLSDAFDNTFHRRHDRLLPLLWYVGRDSSGSLGRLLPRQEHHGDDGGAQGKHAQIRQAARD